MKIGFDGKYAVQNMTGPGNYSRLVMEQMCRQYPEQHFCAYVPCMRDNPRLAPLLPLANLTWRTSSSRFKGWWRDWSMTRDLHAEGISLYHGLCSELPFNIGRCLPSVVTVHDFAFRLYPHLYNARTRRRRSLMYGRAMRMADRVIAVSQHVKDEAVQYFSIDPERIDVIYPGCDSRFGTLWEKSKIARLLEQMCVPRPYILQAGIADRRHNTELTIRALSAMPPQYRLVIAGPVRRSYRRYCEHVAREAGVADRLIWLDNVHFTDLPGLCQGASAIAYTPMYQGFGLPIIEGLESRRPVVATAGAGLEEAGGDAVIYVDYDDPRAMAEALQAVADASSADRAREMIQRGLRRSSRFDTGRMAERMQAVYQQAIDSFCRRQH